MFRFATIRNPTDKVTTQPGFEIAPTTKFVNNIVVRTLTKSTTNEIFKLLTQNIRTVHQKLNAEKIATENTRKLRINLPERLVVSFFAA